MTSHRWTRKPNKREQSFSRQSLTYHRGPLLASKEAITTRRAKTDYDKPAVPKQQFIKGRGIHSY